MISLGPKGDLLSFFFLVGSCYGGISPSWEIIYLGQKDIFFNLGFQPLWRENPSGAISAGPKADLPPPPKMVIATISDWTLGSV